MGGRKSTKRSSAKQARSALGLLEWACRYLPHYFCDAPAAFHAALAAALQDDSKRLIARVAPRGHAKSTCAALALPLWGICEQRFRNIVILSYESTLAVQFVRDIREELESNERIRSDYGELSSRASGGSRGKSRAKWSESKFTTATGITVHGRGSGAGFRGTRVGPHRPDLIICDDIESDEQVRSPQRRAKLENWLRRVVMPALAPGGRLIIVGSLIHHDSLLANLRDRRRFPGWDYAVHRAMEAEPAADGDFRLVPLWPGRWSVEKLQEERRRIGTAAFEQEYMANPVDEARRVFRPEWLRRSDPRELLDRESVTLVAVDPATGRSGGDYFALWVGSIDTRSGVIHTRALTLERIDIVQQVQRIVAAFERYRPQRIGIECNAYQVALKHVLDEYGRSTGRYLPITELKTTGNKRARIEGISPFLENGVFLLPPDLDAEAEKQFLEFPVGRHDDAPDVCALGVELARTYRTAGQAGIWETVWDAADRCSGDW